MFIIDSNIFTARSPRAIGSRILDEVAFDEALYAAVEEHDFSTGLIPGQARIELPDAARATVSGGVGPRSDNPDDYVLRCHRGKVSAYLRRKKAAPVSKLYVVVYTRAAYLADPDIEAKEQLYFENHPEITHVLVTILAFAGPGAPYGSYRLVANLAGGNREALVWDADTIRSKAREAITYEDTWSVVAD